MRSVDVVEGGPLGKYAWVPELKDIEGGTFGAHVDGLEHYIRHGYKCKWGSKPADADAPTADWGIDPGWRYASYRFRQATLSSGELPHACDVVRRWPEGVQRVVVGINTFGRVEGPTEAKLPQ